MREYLASHDFNGQDSVRDNGLWWAVHMGNTHLLELLLEHGANPNAAFRKGTVLSTLPGRYSWSHTGPLAPGPGHERLLSFAAYRGRIKIVEVLLDCDRTERDWHNQAGWTALVEACQSGCFKMVRMFVDTYARDGTRVLPAVRFALRNGITNAESVAGRAILLEMLLPHAQLADYIFAYDACVETADNDALRVLTRAIQTHPEVGEDPYRGDWNTALRDGLQRAFQKPGHYMSTLEFLLEAGGSWGHIYDILATIKIGRGSNVPCWYRHCNHVEDVILAGPNLQTRREMAYPSSSHDCPFYQAVRMVGGKGFPVPYVHFDPETVACGESLFLLVAEWNGMRADAIRAGLGSPIDDDLDAQELVLAFSAVWVRESISNVTEETLAAMAAAAVSVAERDRPVVSVAEGESQHLLVGDPFSDDDSWLPRPPGW